MRLVNSGFGSGGGWDDQYDAMAEGWLLFLCNLKLHLQHFAGQNATASLPMAMWAGDGDAIWTRLLGDLGLPSDLAAGDRAEVNATDAPVLAGTVVETGPRRLALLVDRPAPGTAFIAAEGSGEGCGVSIWTYLYGEAGATAAANDLPGWQAWLAARSTT